MPFIDPTRLHGLLSPSRTRRERSDRSRADSCARAGTRTRAPVPAHRGAADHYKGVVVRPNPDTVHRSDAPPRTPLVKPDAARALGLVKSGWLCACAGTRTCALFPAHRVAEDHHKGVVVSAHSRYRSSIRGASTDSSHQAGRDGSARIDQGRMVVRARIGEGGDW